MKRLMAFCFVLALNIGAPMGMAEEPAPVFDFSNNTGFVPASIVQSLLGLNNGQIKKYASGVSFPVVLWTTKALYCDNGAVLDFSYGESFDVVPSLVQSRKQLDGFQLSGVTKNHLFVDPAPIAQLCSVPGTLGASTTIIKTLMTGVGGENVIVLQEIDRF